MVNKKKSVGESIDKTKNQKKSKIRCFIIKMTFSKKKPENDDQNPHEENYDEESAANNDGQEPRE